MRVSLIGPTAGLAILLAGTSALAQAGPTDPQQCEAGDGPACHRLGRAAAAEGGARGPTQAWLYYGRACELGEPEACDDAAALARAQQRWMAAESFEEDARRLRQAGPYLPRDAGVADQQACQGGDRKACRRAGLAGALRAGPEAIRARLWLARACQLGEREACEDLERLGAFVDPDEDPSVPPPVIQPGFDAGRLGKATARAAPIDAGAPPDGVPKTTPPPLVPAPPGADEPAPAVDAGTAIPLIASEVEGRGRAVEDHPPSLLDSARGERGVPPGSTARDAGTPARGAPPGELAGEAAPAEQPPRSEYRNVCLSEGEKERYRSVLATKNDPTAFRPSAVWAPPLFMTDAERSYTWAALLYFQSLDFEEGTRTRVVPPFFASHCAPDSQTLLTPFYSYRTDAEGTAALYFTYFRRRDRLVETDVLFPLAYSFRERTSEDAPWVGSGAFLPFAFWKRDPSGAQFTLVPPFFWRWGDDETLTTLVGNVYLRNAADRYDLGIVPLYFRGRGARGDYDISPALFWSFRDGPSHSLVLPLLLTVHTGDADTESTWAVNTWYQRRPGGFTFNFVPLLFVGREGASHHTFLPPLFWRWGDDEQTTTIAANVFWHESKQRSDLGIVPLYFRGQSLRDGAYDVSPLLFWSFRDGKKHSLFLPPLLTFHRGDGETESTWALNTWYQSRPHGFSLTVFPLLFAGSEADDRHVIVPPLFWMWGDHDETTTIAGNVFWHRSQAGTDLGIVPLYFRGRSTTGEAYDVSPLLFWSFRDGRKHTLFLPPLLTYFQTRPDGFTLNFVPLLFAGREDADHHAVVPGLFARWGDAEETTTIAANVFWHQAKTRFDLGIVPLYFHGRTASSAYDISPLLFWSFREGPRHSLLIPPLLAYHQGDGETESTWAINTWYQSRPSGFTLASVPFLFTGQEGDEHHTVIPPLLFARWGDRHQTTTFAGPLYWQGKEGRTHFGLAPLYFGGRSTAGNFDVSPLLFWSFREGLRHRLVIPPLLAFHEGDGETESTWALNTWFQSRPGGFTLASIPFLFTGQEGDEHHTVIPPLLFARWGDRHQTTTFAGPLYWQGKEGRTHFGLAPLYFGGRSAAGNFDVSPLLFWSFREGLRHRLVIPPLLAYHEGDGETESTWALNTWFQSRPGGFTLTSFPFLFLGEEGASHHTVIPPLLFARWGDAHQTTTFAGPLYWQGAEGRHHFGLAPLYFGGRSTAGNFDVSPLLFWSFREGPRHRLVIPPLLTFHEGDGETESTWALNTWFQSRRTGFTLASVPLLFVGREGDQHHTIVPPLFWRWGDAEESTTIAANVFFHRTPARWDFGIVPLYFSGRGEKGDYDASPLLFWSFRDGPRRSLLIPPLLTYWDTDGETDRAWVLNTWFESRPNGFTLNSFPFLFAGQEGDAFHTILPPLFWDWGDLKERTTIAGPVYWRQKPGRSRFGLMPLYLGGRGEGGDFDLVPPLVFSFRDREKWSLLLPPLATYLASDGDTQTVLVANTWYQRRPNGFTLNVVPLLFLKEQGAYHHTLVPPLFWRWGDRDEQTTIVANVFWHRTPVRFDLGIVPLYFRGSSLRGGDYDISPLLFWSFRDGPHHSLLIPPLLAFHTGDGETESTWALNTWYQSRKNGFTLASVPLLFVGREGEEHHTIVPPLFWRWGDHQTTTTVVGTFFHRSRPEGSVFGLAPLYFGGRSGDSAWDLVLPLFFRTRTGDTLHVTMPPFFDYHATADSKLFLSPLAVYSKDAEHERTVLGGLYWNMSGPDLSARVVAPFWWDFRSKKKGTRISTVFPLYWRYEKPEEVTHLFLNLMFSHGQTELGPSWSFHLFPLFDLRSYHPKHFLWQVLAGLLGRETQGELQRWRFGWIWTDPTPRGPPAPELAVQPAAGTEFSRR